MHENGHGNLQEESYVALLPIQVSQAHSSFQEGINIWSGSEMLTFQVHWQRSTNASQQRLQRNGIWIMHTHENWQKMQHSFLDFFF